LLKAIEAGVKKGTEHATVDDKLAPPTEKRFLTMDKLPAECKTVLNTPAPTAIAGGEKPQPQPTAAAAVTTTEKK
jgi:hypothetical protein